jgi:hypothetical protein
MKIGICNAEVGIICNCWRKADKLEESYYRLLGFGGFTNEGVNLCDPKNDTHNEKFVEACEFREEIE